jgi:hypothetical protein
MTDCEYCGKPLKKIGFDRANGRLYSGNYGRDWSSRKYHKKCYKLVKEQENIELMLEALKQTKCPPAS